MGGVKVFPGLSLRGWLQFFYEVGWGAFQCLGQADDVKYCNIPGTSLYVADVCSMQTRQFGQFLLRDSLLLPTFPDRQS